MPLIDRDALKEKLKRSARTVKGIGATKEVMKCFAYCIDQIDRAPTIDPVKRGRWICNPDESKFSLVCSICGQVMPFVPECLPDEPPFCNCGAKMDESKLVESHQFKGGDVDG